MILVTGGTGLVGSHLIKQLLLQNKSFRALKRCTSNLSWLRRRIDNDDLFNRIEWVDGDVLDVFSLLEAMQGVEKVYHCAAVVSFRPKDNERMMKINVEGTANIVNMALQSGVKKLCHVSSIASLSRVGDGKPIDEKAVWKDSKLNTQYAISKYCSEREVWRGTVEGLDAVIVNPSMIIGPGDWNNSSSKMFLTAYKGLKYYTEGINGFVDVRDVARSMIELTDSEIKNERFIISAEDYSFRDFFAQVSFFLGKPVPNIKVTPFLAAIAWRIEALKSFLTGRSSIITRETASTANQKNYYSNEKIKKALNFQFIPVAQSIKDTSYEFLKDVDEGWIS